MNGSIRKYLNSHVRTRKAPQCSETQACVLHYDWSINLRIKTKNPITLCNEAAKHTHLNSVSV